MHKDVEWIKNKKTLRERQPVKRKADIKFFEDKEIVKYALECCIWHSG